MICVDFKPSALSIPQCFSQKAQPQRKHYQTEQKTYPLVDQKKNTDCSKSSKSMKMFARFPRTFLNAYPNLQKRQYAKTLQVYIHYSVNKKSLVSVFNIPCVTVVNYSVPKSVDCKQKTKKDVRVTFYIFSFFLVT